VIIYATIQKMLNDNCLGIPEPGKLPGSTRKLPFILIGYDAFAMRENLFKPYRQTTSIVQQLISNY
jgi:hypothetical protein